MGGKVTQPAPRFAVGDRVDVNDDRKLGWGSVVEVVPWSHASPGALAMGIGVYDPYNYFVLLDKPLFADMKDPRCFWGRHLRRLNVLEVIAWAAHTAK